MNVGAIAAKLTLDLTEFRGGLQRASVLLTNHAQAMQQAGMVAAGFGAALAGGIAIAVKEAAEFEAQMRNVNSILKESEEGFQALSQSVLQLAGDVGQAPEQLARGLYDIASSGFAGAEGMKVLEAAARAAIAGVSDTATAAKAITAVLNAYGLAAEEAGRVSDILFKTVERGVINFSELAQNLGDVVSTAAQANVSIEQVGAAIATMTRAGVQPAEAVTSLNQVMLSFIKPQTDATEAAAKLGIELTATSLAAKGLPGVIAEIGRALKLGTLDLDAMTKAGLSESEIMAEVAKRSGGAAEAMAALFPNVRALRGALVLASEGGREFAGDVEAMSHATGAAAAAFAEQSKSFAVQFQRFKASVLVLADAIGRQLLPTLTSLAQKAGAVARAIANFADQNQGLTKALVVMAVGLAGFSLAIGGLLIALGPLVAGLGGLVTAGPALAGAFSLVAGAVAAAAGPIGVAVAVVAALAAVVYTLSTRSREAADAVKPLGEMTAAQAREVQKLVTRYGELERIQRRSVEQNREMRDVLDQLVKIAPQLADGFDREGHAIGLVADAAERATAQLRALHLEQLRQQAQQRSSLAQAASDARDALKANQDAIAELEKRKKGTSWYTPDLIDLAGINAQIAKLKAEQPRLAAEIVRTASIAKQAWKDAFGPAETKSAPKPPPVTPAASVAATMKQLEAEEERLRTMVQIATTQKDINAAQRDYFSFARKSLPFVFNAWKNATDEEKKNFAALGERLADAVREHGKLAEQDRLTKLQQAKKTGELLQMDIKRAETHEQAVFAAQQYVTWLGKTRAAYEDLAKAPGAKPEILEFAKDLQTQFHEIGTVARWTAVSSAEAMARMTRATEDHLPVYRSEAEAIDAEVQAQQRLATQYQWTARQQAVALQGMRDAHKDYYAARPKDLEDLNAKVAVLNRQGLEQEQDLEVEKAAFRAEIGQASLAEYLKLLDKRAAASQAEAGRKFGYTRARYQAEQALEEQKWQYLIETGQRGLDQYLSELQRRANAMVPWSPGWIRAMGQVADVQHRIHQQRLADIDEEISAAAQGSAAQDAAYQKKLGTLSELIAGERNIATVIELQREHRSTLDAWIDSALWKLDQQVLSIWDQRDALVEVAGQFGAIDSRLLPAIQDRLRAVLESIAEMEFSLRNVLIGAAQGIESAFTGFFDGIGQRSKSFADLWMGILASIQRQLAQMLTDRFITPIFGRMEMARRRDAAGAAQSAVAAATPNNLSPALQAFSAAASALPGPLAGWAQAALAAVGSVVAQITAATTQTAASVAMAGASAAQIGAGTTMLGAGGIMVEAAATMLTAAGIYEAASAASGGILEVMGLQHGGIVTRPTLAIVGEAGAEAVVPLDRAGAMGGVTFEPGAVQVRVDPASLDAMGVERLADRMLRRIGQHIDRRQGRV